MKKSQNIFQVLSTLLTKLGLKSNIKSYSGDFKNGHYHGKGRLVFTDGSIYEGEFENNKMHGYGKIFFKDGSIYQGNFKNNLRDGTGKVRSKEGVEQRVVYSKGRFKEVYVEDYTIHWKSIIEGEFTIKEKDSKKVTEIFRSLTGQEILKQSQLYINVKKVKVTDLSINDKTN